MKLLLKQVRLFLIFFALLFSTSLFSQQEPTIKVFNSSNGSLQNTIFTTLTDDIGYLWIAAQNGLFRYDGNNLKRFLFDNSKAETDIGNTMVSMSYIPLSKKIIIRARNGWVYTIQNGRPVLYSKAVTTNDFIYPLIGHFPSEELFNQFNVSAGILKNKYRWNANTREVLPLNNTDFIVLGGGRTEFRDSLLLYRNGKATGAIKVKVPVKLFLKARLHNLYAGADNNLYLYDSSSNGFQLMELGKQVAGFKNSNKEKPSFFWDIHSDVSYCYYDAVFYELQVEPQSKKVNFIPRFTIKDDGINWTNIFYEQASATYFLSTVTSGMYQAKVKRIQTLNPKEDIAGSRNKSEFIKYAVLKTSDSTAVTSTGTEFILSASGMINSQRKGNVFVNRETLARLGDTAILGNLVGKLLYYSSSDGYKQARLYNRDFDAMYTTLLQPEGDSLWVCNSKGVYAVTRKTVTPVFDKLYDGFFLDQLKLFYRISPSEVLVSNNKGLFKLRTLPPYGIDSIPEMEGKQVRHITKYGDVLILSVYKHGIYLFKNNTFYKVPGADDRPELKTIHSTYIDKTGAIWITTDHGLLRSTAASVVNAPFNKEHTVFYYSYGVADGIVNTEFNGAGTPPYAVLRDEQLFYPSMGGIVSFKPSDLNDKITSAVIPVEKIIIDNSTIDNDKSDTITLASDYKLLAIEFSVPNFGEAENLVLEYRIDKESWKRIPVKTGQLLQLLDNFSPGYHQLTIRRQNGFGETDYTYREIILFKKRGLYEHWWFFPLIAIAVVLLLLGLLELKTRNLRKKKALLQQKINEQTAELSHSVEVKDLLINIVAHDMTNPLRHISLIAHILSKGLEKDPEKAASALLDIKATSEKLLSSSVDITNWMKYNNQREPVIKKKENLHDMVEDVVELYKVGAQNKGIEIINAVGQDEEVIVDHTIVSIILNNLIANAKKHSKQSNVLISAERSTDGTATIVKIADKGEGIKEEMLWIIREVLKGNIKAIKTTAKLNTGLGYIMIAELLKLHSLSVTIDSEEGKGTKVSLVIPDH